MQRRKANTTYYDRRKRHMLWRVEWEFPRAQHTVVNERVDEETTLGELLQAHLQYKWVLGAWCLAEGACGLPLPMLPCCPASACA